MFQTGAWHRGMGQYMIHLLKALAATNSPKELYVVFNTNLPIERSRLQELQKICPRLKRIQWSLPLPEPGKVKAKNEAAYKRELEKCISSSVESNTNNVSYLITSPFTFDFFALFPEGYTKLLVFYDLTPLLHWKDLGGYFPPELYMQRFKQIFEADMLFAISQTTKNDLLESFALSESKVINIDGGFSGFEAPASKPKFAVPQEYVLFPTGDLPHKNNEVAVRGFSEFCTNSDWNGKMLITSSFSEESKLKLSAESDRLIFTGNIPAEQLRWLYENASAVIFSSKYEGLGIPLLDAVSNNVPALASRIPVFLEMTKNAYYFFDPQNPSELAGELEKALTTTSFKAKKSAYVDIMKKYTWARTAEKFVAGFNTVKPNKQKTTLLNHERIAIASMHPGLEGTIGRLAEKLFVKLFKDYDIDFYFDTNGAHPKDMERPTFLDQQNCRVFDISRLTHSSYRRYEKVIYILDENSLHRVAQRAAVLPGYLIHNLSSERSDMFRSVIIKNQHKELRVGNKFTDKEVEVIWQWIQKLSPNKKLLEVARELRSSSSNRSIMSRLMEKHQNDQ